MQKYKEVSQKRNIHKEILCEFLDFLKFKVENDGLTADEVRSLVNALVGGTDIYATAQELATFYDQSQHNVRCARRSSPILAQKKHPSPGGCLSRYLSESR